MQTSFLQDHLSKSVTFCGGQQVVGQLVDQYRAHLICCSNWKKLFLAPKTSASVRDRSNGGGGIYIGLGIYKDFFCNELGTVFGKRLNISLCWFREPDKL